MTNYTLFIIISIIALMLALITFGFVISLSDRVDELNIMVFRLSYYINELVDDKNKSVKKGE